jgi:D-proline reductase (dithiol) PrdB
MADVNPNDPSTMNPRVDRTHRTYIDYIERTRAHYLAEGFNNPYAWSQFDHVPFTPLTRPVRDCRIGLISTAAPYQPEKGDQGPYAAYNNDAKFGEVYQLPVDTPPDLRISHIGFDRNHTVPTDINAYLPLERLKEAVRAGEVGGIPHRFYGVPTLRSQRHTVETDAPTILQWCREDGVDAAVLVAV